MLEVRSKLDFMELVNFSEREAEVKDASELKSGWLNLDMERAERRVVEWNIRKYVSPAEIHEENEKNDKKELETHSSTLSC